MNVNVGSSGYERRGLLHLRIAESIDDFRYRMCYTTRAKSIPPGLSKSTVEPILYRDYNATCAMRSKYGSLLCSTRLPCRQERTASMMVKAVIAVVLAAIAGAAFLWMSQEQQARTMSQEIYQSLADAVDDHLTVDEVHERLGRNP